jgi:hypothetical protein
MAKHKYIETPEKMWELFQAYKKKAKDDPFLQHDFVGKDGESVHRQKERCLTMEGFENYCEDQDVITDLSKYFANTDKAYEEFRSICSRIRRHIRQDQIEGGMAGVYNPSITQRLNGLVEKSAVQVTEQPLFPDVPKDNGD